METLILDTHQEGAIERAADIIRGGGLVAFPTETVYGLGGNGLMEEAATRIYAAKGRPSDNPLILHLSDPLEAEKYCYVNPLYYTLAAAFMPGPLTVIMPKRPNVPYTVTGGLETVAVRVPSDPIAHLFLERCGVPVAAPSANISGRPSPTTAEHVIEDMDGRIEMILCGGECEIGLESTIVKLEAEHLTLLRPGAITPQMLESVFPMVEIDDCSMRAIGKDEKPAAPGMKYRHYAPKATVIVLDGDAEEVLAYQKNAAKEAGVGVLCYEEHFTQIEGDYVCSMGKDISQMAKSLFSCLRSFDSHNEIRIIYASMPPEEGIGMAVRNRLLKAAGFSVLKL